MTIEQRTSVFGSFAGAVLGIVLIAVSLFISVPVAVNFPESWPGAVLAVCLAFVALALIVAHLRHGHRRMRENQVNEGG